MYLQKKRLDSLTNNGAARDVYHDAKVQGLQLRVSSTGRKTFISRPSLDGKPIMVRMASIPIQQLSKHATKRLKHLIAVVMALTQTKLKRISKLKSLHWVTLCPTT